MNGEDCMIDSEMHRKPTDLIRSEDWNKLVDELIELRKYVEQMTRSVTLTNLESPSGKSYSLTGNVPDEYNYGTHVMGLLTKQYFIGIAETGEICIFGIHDFADMIYYWSGAAYGDKIGLQIFFMYNDNEVIPSKELFVHEWSKLRPKGDQNPYIEYFPSPTNRIMYRYGIQNPKPDKMIRFIIFNDLNNDCGLRIGNSITYVTKIRQLPKTPEDI
jgi:hypothetical protein